MLHGNDKVCPDSNAFVQTVMNFQKASQVRRATRDRELMTQDVYSSEPGSKLVNTLAESDLSLA